MRWMALFIDTEGSISMNRNLPKGSHTNVRYTPCISMGITSQPLANDFEVWLAKYGIKFYKQTRIYPEPFKPVYSFIIRRLTYAKPMLEMILPFLREKRKQAELMIEFITSRCHTDGTPKFRGGTGQGAYPQRTHDIWAEMRVLNNRNVPKGDPSKNAWVQKENARLSRLHDYTSSVRILNHPVSELENTAKDIASSAYERCSDSKESVESLQ